MRRILSVILWLTLIPAVFALPMPDNIDHALPSNFEIYPQMEPVPAGLGLSANLPEAASRWGSLMGFVDFTATDNLLGFLDDFVLNNLQHHDLRTFFAAVLNAPIVEIEMPYIIVDLGDVEIAE